MVEILSWQDPPTRNPGRGNDYSKVIEQLKAKPGQWALVIKDWKTTAAPAAFRQAGCETTTRRNEDGKTWSVFVRYPNGDPKTRADAGNGRKAQGTPTTPGAAPAQQQPAPAAPRQLPPPQASGGYSKFLASQRVNGR